MKKVLILSVFAFFAFAVNAQTAANTSDKTTTEVAQTKDAGSSAKSVALGGNAATAADKATNSKGSQRQVKRCSVLLFEDCGQRRKGSLWQVCRILLLFQVVYG